MKIKTSDQIMCGTLKSDLHVGKSIQSLTAFGVVAVLCACISLAAHGGPVKQTAASGGESISADNYTSGAWVTLTGPSLAENKAGKIGTGTIVLTVPSGFEFDPAALVTVAVSGSATAAKNINNTANNGTIAATVTSSTITITITSVSSGTANTLTCQNIRVRPTAGTPLASGDLDCSGTADGLSKGGYGTLTEVAGAATQLVVTRQPSTTATAGTAFGTQPQVAVLDSYGSTVSSYATAVTAVETSGGNLNGTLTGKQTANTSKGVATFTGLYMTNAASGVTLTFSSGSLPAVTSSGIKVGPALANTLTMAQQPSASATAGVAFARQPQVMVKDPYGNLVSDGTAVSATETSGGNLNATTGAPTAKTTAGVASFSGLYVTNAATVTLTFRANGHSVTSANIIVSAAGASKLAFGQQPTTRTAGSAFSPAVTVRVQDPYGNTVTTDSSSVTIASSTTAFTPDSILTANAASGVATFSAIKPTTAGTGKTLTASDDGFTGATSTTFTVNPATASKLAFGVQPSTTTAGSAISPAVTVKVQDQYGNTVTSDSSSVTIAGSTTAFTTDSVLKVNAVSGVATFSAIKPTTPGAQNLTASDGNLTGATSGTFTVKSAAAGNVAYDDFNRADSADLGGNWSPLSGSGAFGHLAIANSNAIPIPNTPDVDCYSYWTNDVFTGDQFSQIAIPNIGSYVAVIARASSTVDSFYQGYVSGQNAYGIAVRWNGTWVLLASGGAAIWQPGQTVTLAAVGSNPVTLTLYQNGTPVLTTSTSAYVISGGSPGLGGANLPLDNWQGGSIPPPEFTSHVSDDFNRADASDLGGNWTPLLGASPQPFSGHLVTVSSQAVPNAPGGDCLSYWSANTFSDDQYSQALIPKVGYYVTVIVRADSQNRFYEAFVTDKLYGIAKYWDGQWSAPLVFGDNTGQSVYKDGDTVRLEVTGSAHPMTLTMYHNGNPVLTWTSSSAADVKTGGSPGIGIGDASGVGLRVDNWEGGSVVAP